MTATSARIVQSVLLVVAFGLGRAAQVTVEEGDAAGLYVDCSWSSMQLRAWNVFKARREDMLKNWPCKKVPDFSRKNSKKTIACIGDSITHGSNVERTESYPALLHHLFKEEYNVINLGVSGAAAQVKSDKPYWDLMHWNVSLRASFDVAIVQLGSNDAKTRNWDKSVYMQDYGKMLAELKQRHPQATFVISVPPPAYNNSFDIQPEVVSSELRDAIQKVSSSAHLKSAPIDMQRAFADAEARAAQDTERPLLQVDNVHPTAAGYVVMARTAAEALARVLQLPADALAPEE